MVSKRNTVDGKLRRSKASYRMLSLSISRFMDLSIAIAAMIFLAPLLALIALVIVVEGKGPVLFAHNRIGRNGARFKILKFRSMVTDGDYVLARHLESCPEAAAEWAKDHKLRNDPRITRVGGFLRKSSLDELPQLINVIVGDMSLVGPRPIVEAEIQKYGRFFLEYCSIRPGITGIWQVSGRNDVTYRRRVAMDAVYSKRKCIALDLWLIIYTIPAVIGRKGSY